MLASALVGYVTSVLLQIETNRLGKMLEIGILQRMLMMEDRVTHLSEFPLRCGSLGCQSRVQRVGLGTAADP